jgi:hypothetical protein
MDVQREGLHAADQALSLGGRDPEARFDIDG